MSEIEKMKRYISRTKMDKDDRYCLVYREAAEMGRTVRNGDDSLLGIIGLAFAYGKAKGYRAVKAEGRARA